MTAREVKKLLKAAGWTFEPGGTHQTTKVKITEHGSKDIKIGTSKAIEKATGVNLRGRG